MSTNNKQPIGIFDSGLGGLSILQHIQEELPRESTLYYGDTKNCPYGAKTYEEIRRLTVKGIEFLLQKQVKLVVIACNTATVAGIDFYRKKFKLPIVGVVPVVKTAAEKTKSNVIIVLATKKTAHSKYLKDLIQNFAAGKETIVIPAEGLVSLIESGNTGSPLLFETLTKFLQPALLKGADVIALGCTHYPFINREINTIAGDEVLVLDSGEAVARQVRRVLENENILSSMNNPVYTYYTSGNVSEFKQLAESLLKIKNMTVKSA